MSGAVLVAGPPGAGTSSVVAALQRCVPEYDVVESHSAPAAVVLVASAAAPMTASDCAHLEQAAAASDVVVGALARVDAHRGWRDVLAANVSALGSRAPHLAAIPWAGVAAAPDVGTPDVDTLVAALRSALAEDGPKPLRACGSRAPVVRRTRRMARTAVLRQGLQRERMRTAGEVRHRCAGIQAEQRRYVAGVSRGGAAGVEAGLRTAVTRVADELDASIADRLAELAAQLGVRPPASAELPAPRLPPVPEASARRAETRLTVAIGAGFGLGVAMAVGRLAAGVAPSVAAYGLGALVGCALTAWLVMARGLLGDRVALERWVGEAVAAARWQLDDAVAETFVGADAWFTAELAESSGEG